MPGPTILLGIVTALTYLQLLIVGKGDAPAAMWLLAAVYAGYVTAAILVAGAALSRVRGRPLRPIPLVPQRWSTTSRAYLILAALVALLTGLREGSFAPELILDYDVFQATHRTNTSRSSSSNSTTMGDGTTATMAGQPLACSFQCTNRGPTCAAVLQTLRCDGDDADDSTGPLVIAQGLVTLDDPGCYFPLYKDSHTRYSAQLTLSASRPGSTKSVSLNIDGTLTQDATGPMSCHNYRRLAAQKIAAELAGALQATLDTN